MGGGSSKDSYERVPMRPSGSDLEQGSEAYGSVQTNDDVYPRLDGTFVQNAKSVLFSTSKKEGLTQAEAQRRLGEFGANELAEKKSNPWVKLALEFVQPMPIVVWVAIAIEAIECLIDWPGSSATSDLIDVIVLLLLQFLNVLVGWIEELKSTDAIAKLKQSLNPVACVIREGTERKVPAGELVPGDVVSLENGCAIPADCVVMEGCKPIQVDQSAMTGESLPTTMRPGDCAKMGSTMKSGTCEALVTSTGSQTFFGKTAELIAGVEGMGHFEKVLQQMLIALVSVGAIVIVIVFIYLEVAVEEEFKVVLSFCVVLLIASIPIALKVVCTTTLALGAGELAKEKAIVARLSSIEELAGLSILCSDKTGTLTLNEMILKEDLDPNNPDDAKEFNNLEENHPGRNKFHRVYDKDPDTGKNYTRQDLLQFAGMATEWTKEAKDAIDTMILDPKGPLDRNALQAYEHTDFIPFDPSTKRTMAAVRNTKTKKEFRIAKGATKVMLNMLDKEHRDQIADKFNKEIDAFAARGIRAIAIIRTDDCDRKGKIKMTEEGESVGWRMAGFITFLDPPRPDTAHVISMAKKFGVEVKMITGDAGPIAVEMCKTIGLGHNILIGEEKLKELPIKQLMEDQTLGQQFGEVCENSNGFAQVLPEHKFLIVECLRQSGYLVGMCGDGVNDAPALKRADVGIAVQGATDAAQASSDIVLTEPGLSTIVTAMVVSRKIFTRMKNFVIYRVACTEQLLFFFLISCLAFNPRHYAPDGYHDEDWPEYFALPVIALVTITILNDGTIISVAYDNVEASMVPENWNLKLMYWISSVIGMVALASSLVLLELGLQSARGDGLAKFGIDRMDFGEIQTMMYLKISLSDYCSVFNSRCKSWFWSRKPHNIVLGAAAFAVSAATLLSAYWPFESGMKGIKWNVILFVWIYVLLWSLVQDACKVLNGKALFYFGIIQDLGVINEDELSKEFNEDNSTVFAPASTNMGEPVQRPSRRRTSSMADGAHIEGAGEHLAGFIQPGYNKNETQGRCVIPGCGSVECSHQPTWFRGEGPAVEKADSESGRKGRGRTYSECDEPAAHYHN